LNTDRSTNYGERLPVSSFKVSMRISNRPNSCLFIIHEHLNSALEYYTVPIQSKHIK